MAERKVIVIPFSDVSSFPFIAVYLADTRGKCDEAAEHTYCKLRASGKLLVSTPQNYQRPLQLSHAICSPAYLHFTFQNQTITDKLRAAENKKDSRKIYSSLFLIAEEHD